jgi:hypothetical protein
MFAYVNRIRKSESRVIDGYELREHLVPCGTPSLSLALFPVVVQEWQHSPLFLPRVLGLFSTYDEYSGCVEQQKPSGCLLVDKQLLMSNRSKMTF